MLVQTVRNVENVEEERCVGKQSLFLTFDSAWGGLCFWLLESKISSFLNEG